MTASFASGDDPAALYSVFAAHGGFPFGSVGKADAAHGAVAVTVASLAFLVRRQGHIYSRTMTLARQTAVGTLAKMQVTSLRG